MPQNSTLFTNVGSISYGSVSRDLADVFVVNGFDVANASTIPAFVAAGGGVIVGNEVWSFSGLVSSAPVNTLLSSMGIFVSSGIVWPSGTPLDVSPTTEPSQVANSATLLPCLQASLLGDTSSPCYKAADGDITSLMSSIDAGAAYPPWGTSFWATLATVRCLSVHAMHAAFGVGALCACPPTGSSSVSV